MSEVVVENLGSAKATVTLNESGGAVPPGVLIRLPQERRVTSGSPAAAYEPDFADEPQYDGEIDPRTSH